MQRRRFPFRSLASSPRSCARLSAAAGISTTLVLGALPARAECDNDARLSTCIDADTLWPHPGPARFQSVGATETTAPGEFSVGLVTSYLRKPIVLRAASSNPGGTDVPAIDHMVDMNFLWAMGIIDQLELTVAMPVTLAQNGSGVSAFTSSDAQDVPGSSIRDFRFGAAYALLPRDRAYPGNAFALTSRLEVAAPTGDQDWFGGDRGAVVIPTVAADFRLGQAFAGAEVGARIRKTTNLAGAQIGSQGFVALGAGYDILPGEMLSAGLEAYALPTFADQETLARDPDTQEIVATTNSDSLIPAEWMATVRSAPTRDGDVSFTLSGGSALPLTESAITSPQYRITAGIRFAPLSRDTDGDGVLDREDQCPREREDRDGFQDEDGCIDADNDRDAIADTADRCRDKAEDKDGFEDEDGCPEADDDKDGIEDAKDSCRFKPEDKDGFQDDDGCPDPDNDGDGIEDAKDTCAGAAEDRDGYNDTDGCPDPDNDVDGIPDEADKCPLTREDKDGFQDDDGCPEMDNDSDGVPDKADQCPNEPETIDGNADADGCPEAGAKDLTIVNGTTITVAQPVRFAAGTSRITPAMRKQLVMMAQRALGQQPVAMVIVQTYADRAGATERNESLAADRADAIRQVLIEAGLPADSLTAAVGDLTSQRGPTAPQYDITVQRGSYK